MKDKIFQKLKQGYSHLGLGDVGVLYRSILAAEPAVSIYILNRMYVRSSNELLPFANAFVALKV